MMLEVGLILYFKKRTNCPEIANISIQPILVMAILLFWQHL